MTTLNTYLTTAKCFNSLHESENLIFIDKTFKQG